MPCDICSKTHEEFIIAPEAMSAAVKRGFNPFHLRLLPPPLASLATPDYPSKWNQQAIDGSLSQSHWTLCDTCLPKLKLYLIGEKPISRHSQAG